MSPAGALCWPQSLPGPGGCARSPAPKPGLVWVSAGFSLSPATCASPPAPTGPVGTRAPRGPLHGPNEAEEGICAGLCWLGLSVSGVLCTSPQVDGPSRLLSFLPGERGAP